MVNIFAIYANISTNTVDLSIGNATGKRIVNLATPVGGADATTKAYVDSLVSGIDPKESCRLATTVDLGATYNAAGGVGGTGQFTSAPTTIDSILIVAGDRILVKNQSVTTQNGIYVVTATTTIWDRASDQDGSPSSEVSGGNFTFIEIGSVNASTGWVLQGDGELILNTDPLVWVKFSAAGAFSAGNGIDIAGSTISVDLGGGGDDGLEFATGKLAASLAGSSNAGVMRLAGDFGGSAVDPDVVGITGTVGVVDLDSTLTTFSSAGLAGTDVTFNFANAATAGAGGWKVIGQAGGSNNIGGSINLIGGAGGPTGAGGIINLTGGSAGSTSGKGGDINVTASDGFDIGDGGDINITSGIGGLSSSKSGDINIIANYNQSAGGDAGVINITGGVSFNNASIITLTGGGSINGNAGKVILIGGDALYNGSGASAGDVEITGGNADDTSSIHAGDVIITGGAVKRSGVNAASSAGGVTISGGINNGGSGVGGGSISIIGSIGYGVGNGGQVYIESGEGAGTGDGGDIILATNTGTTAGDIILRPAQVTTAGSVIVEGSGTIIMNEVADHSRALVAGEGALWVRSDSPNALIFTDDNNIDYNLLSGATTAFPIDKYVVGVVASGSSSTTVHTISANNQTVIIRCEVVGRSGGNESVGFMLFGLFEDIGGTILQIGSTSVVAFAEDAVGWDATFAISGSNIQVTVTNGDGLNTANFHITGIASEQT